VTDVDTCPVDHVAVKTDELQWAGLRFNGVQHMDYGDGCSEDLEVRTCTCGTTLARIIACAPGPDLNAELEDRARLIAEWDELAKRGARTGRVYWAEDHPGLVSIAIAWAARRDTDEHGGASISSIRVRDGRAYFVYVGDVLVFSFRTDAKRAVGSRS
jgi:hypothetical protein